MPFPDINPIAFAIGPFAVRWYALAYLFMLLLGAFNVLLHRYTGQGDIRVGVQIGRASCRERV